MEEIIELLTVVGKIHDRNYDKDELETIYKTASALRFIIAGKLAPSFQLAMASKRLALRLLDEVSAKLDSLPEETEL